MKIRFHSKVTLIIGLSLLSFEVRSDQPNSSIARQASKWEGRHYRRGQSLQCANWVGQVVKEAGGTPPTYHSMARNWLQWGRPVSKATIRPGDIVITWRGSRSGKSGHILIYLGQGQCIHRPTYSKSVRTTSLSFYESRILGVRRGKAETSSPFSLLELLTKK